VFYRLVNSYLKSKLDQSRGRGRFFGGRLDCISYVQRYCHIYKCLINKD
jgi:hypothetical protein